MCETNCYRITAKSSENTYQYVQAIRRGNLDIAKMIKDGPTAYLVKQTAKWLPYNSSRKTEKLSVMKDILEHKCKQVLEFREALINSKSNKPVEATPGNYFWSSGLNKEDTLNTKTKYWFGQNKMGLLLTEIHSTLQDSSQIQGSQDYKKHKQSSLFSQKSVLKCKSAGNCESDSE